MSRGSALASLVTLFGNTQEETDDSDKLKELYWNRAELKKEFASLREETYKLKEEIKNREGRAARLQQKLDHLESLLLDPEWVHNVAAYYQLRALNENCKAKLARFAEQLKQQREKRKHGELLQSWRDENQGEAQSIEERIGGLRMKVQMLEDQLQAETHRLATMNGLVRLFRKRSVNRSIETIESDLLEAHETEAQLLAELETIHRRDEPNTQGLDISSKRSINFMILAFAQQLYLHLCDDNLAALAKESGDKGVGAINYGSKRDCDVLISLIAKYASSMENISGFADTLQQRSQMMAEKAMYNNDDDAVPVSGTVATVFDIDANGRVRESDANLLGENYWDLANVMSR